MTLIITSISKHGIAMVADSAATTNRIVGRPIITEVIKLQAIPYLNAGISMWGLGTMPISQMPTYKWVENFIKNHDGLTSLESFARILAGELQQEVGDTKKEMGMHVAGYVNVEGELRPTLYHVRNVDGTYENYAYHRFEESLHHPPLTDEEIDRGWCTRNGSYGIYAHLFAAIQDVIPVILQKMAREIPHPSLTGEVLYHAAWIRFMSNLYESASLERTIGGKIVAITISPDNELSYPNLDLFNK